MNGKEVDLHTGTRLPKSRREVGFCYDCTPKDRVDFRTFLKSRLSLFTSSHSRYWLVWGSGTQFRVGWVKDDQKEVEVRGSCNGPHEDTAEMEVWPQT